MPLEDPAFDLLEERLRAAFPAAREFADRLGAAALIAATVPELWRLPHEPSAELRAHDTAQRARLRSSIAEARTRSQAFLEAATALEQTRIELLARRADRRLRFSLRRAFPRALRACGPELRGEVFAVPDGTRRHRRVLTVSHGRVLRLSTDYARMLARLYEAHGVRDPDRRPSPGPTDPA